MAPDTWTRRDLPVLSWLVEHFDPVDARRVLVKDVVEGTGLSEEDVKASLRDLTRRADPPYLTELRSMGSGSPSYISGVTERALREAGAWPTADGLVDALVATLNARADAEPDEDRRGVLRRAASGLGGAARDVVVDVTAAVITGRIPT